MAADNEALEKRRFGPDLVRGPSRGSIVVYATYYRAYKTQYFLASLHANRV
jgi:hypothetical protein